MSNNPFTRLRAFIVEDEPVIARMLFLLLAALVGEFVVGHNLFGVTEESWTALTNSVAPTVTVLVTGVITWLMRQKVFAPSTVAALQGKYDAALAKMDTMVPGFSEDANALTTRLQEYVKAVAEAHKNSVPGLADLLDETPPATPPVTAVAAPDSFSSVVGAPKVGSVGAVPLPPMVVSSPAVEAGAEPSQQPAALHLNPETGTVVSS